MLEHVRREGLPTRRGLIDRRIDEAIALYASGRSVAHVAEALGVNTGTLWMALRRHGVAMRDTHGRSTSVEA